MAAVFCGAITVSRMCCQFSHAAAASDGIGGSGGVSGLTADSAITGAPADAAAAKADVAGSSGNCAPADSGLGLDSGATDSCAAAIGSSSVIDLTEISAGRAAACDACISRSSSSEASSVVNATFSATQRDLLAAASPTDMETASVTVGSSGVGSIVDSGSA